jgi:hypothetical protein
VVADFPAKDRGPNGDGVGAGRTVEKAIQDVMRMPYFTKPALFPPGETKPGLLDVDGPFIGYSEITLDGVMDGAGPGDVGLCVFIAGPDGIVWPGLSAVKINGQLYQFDNVHATKGQPGAQTIESIEVGSMEELEAILDLLIGRKGLIRIATSWRDRESIGIGTPGWRGGPNGTKLVDLFPDTAYFRKITAEREAGTLNALTYDALLDTYITEDDFALLLQTFAIYLPEQKSLLPTRKNFCYSV